MTLIGFILIPLALFVALRRPDHLLHLLVLCSFLEAASVINIGRVGIAPYYLVGSLVFIRVVVRSVSCLQVAATARLRPLVYFFVWTSFSAVAAPIVFGGMLVVDPRAPLEQVLFGLTPLHLAVNNFMQVGLLAINIAALLEAEFSEVDLWPVFRYAVLGEIVVIFIQAAIGDRFPYSLLNNNAAYEQAHISSLNGLTRPSGTFVEPSVAGALLAGVAAFYLAGYLRGRWRLWNFLICLGALILVGSGSGLAGFGVTFVMIVVTFRPWKGLYIKVGLLIRWVVLAGCALTAALSVAPLVSYVAANTVDKRSSFSMVVRAGVDLIGMHILLQTNGFGVGLGSFRGSSLAVTMLACTGLPGAILFSWFLIRFRVSWLVGGTLLAMALGVPDLSLPIIWSVLIVQQSAGSALAKEVRSTSKAKLNPIFSHDPRL